MNAYFSDMFSKFADINTPTIIALICLVLFAGGLLLSARKTKWDTRMLAYAALCIALSFVLSLIRLYRMPQGGSITPASMLPLILYSYIFGAFPGLIVCTAYGLLQLIFDPYILSPMQTILDYVLSYGVMGLAGIARSLPLCGKAAYLRLPIGAVVAGALRTLMNVISGVVFFAEYAGDMNPWIYSIGYNGSFIGVDTLICIVIICIPAVQSIAERTAASFHHTAMPATK